MSDLVRDSILEVIEDSLDAQLRAVRRLRHGEREILKEKPQKHLSQLDMATYVLSKAHSPLHISDILAAIQLQFGVSLDRESLVSSLTKKVIKQDRFLRTAKNTFALR